MSRTVLDDVHFFRLRTLLGKAAGLVFDESRRDSLALSVAERLKATCHSGVPDYLDVVESETDDGLAERQQLLDEVTIQETHFFRNPPQMRALRTHVLPQLLREAEGRGRRLRIWSAGCSTGEEPYTLAMMLRELLPSVGGWDAKVIGSDLSQTALAAARRGTYGARALQLADERERSRFFTAAGRGRFAVSSAVRELVEFRHHNLVTDPPVEDGLDLVLCRNVTIYFARETTRALVERLHTSLRDGGYLVLGHSETLWQVNSDFQLVTVGAGRDAAYLYRRPETVSAAVATDAVRRVTVRSTTAGPKRDRQPPRRARSTTRRPTVPRPTPPGDDAPATVRRALDDGQYEQAARLARLAAAHDPLRSELHYLLGVALVDLGRDEEALPALRRAVYLSPESGLAHFLLAGALQRTGDAAAAAREFRAAARTLDGAGDGAPELGGRSARELATLCAEMSSQT